MKRFFRAVRCSRSVLVIFALFAVPSVVQAGGGTLNLQKTASFETGLNVPDVIRNGCRIDSKLIDFIELSASEDFDKISLVEEATPGIPGSTLAVEIVDLAGAGGGAWSGPKHLTIRGTLWKDGKVAGTFTARRVTGGGIWGAYRGTCSLLGRCARALGKDVSGWLKNPSMDAKLGEDH